MEEIKKRLDDFENRLKKIEDFYFQIKIKKKR